jgi:hypothetical protein
MHYILGLHRHGTAYEHLDAQTDAEALEWARARVAARVAAEGPCRFRYWNLIRMTDDGEQELARKPFDP